MMQRWWIFSPLVLASLIISILPATAQLVITPRSSLPLTITESAERAGQFNRAKNLARQAAERANGGLSNYRAEDAMHGPAAEAPFVDNDNGTVTFDFVGSRPGSDTPTYQTIATVNLESGAVNLDYNGPIR